MKKSGIYFSLLSLLLITTALLYLKNGGVPDQTNLVQRENLYLDPLVSGDFFVIKEGDNRVSEYMLIVEAPNDEEVVIIRDSIPPDDQNVLGGWMMALMKDEYHSDKDPVKISKSEFIASLDNYLFHRKMHLTSNIPIMSRIQNTFKKQFLSWGGILGVFLIALILWMAEASRRELSTQFESIPQQRIWLWMILGGALFVESLQFVGYLEFFKHFAISANGFWFPTLFKVFIVSLPVFLLYQYVTKKYGHKDFIIVELLRLLVLFVFGVLFNIIAYMVAEGVGFLFNLPSTQFLYNNHASIGWVIPDFRKFWTIFAIANFLNNFRKHVVELRKKEKQLVITEKKVLSTESELDALQARVNPHFLYNSLNSLASLALADPAKTEEMALALSDFYKRSTNRQDEHLSSLEEEVEMLKTYLNIEKIRFRERLKYELVIDENCKDFQIPRFLLQPIVENAIKYGYDKASNEIKIKVEAKKKDKALHINIYDSGKPFSVDLSTGYGLRSVKKKLKLLFQDKHDIQFINEPEKCVWIVVR